MNDLTIPRKLNFLVFTLAVFAVLFVFSKPVMAQATTGTLKGAVVDPQGAAIGWHEDRPVAQVIRLTPLNFAHSLRPAGPNRMTEYSCG